jgi:hypothetical protein
MVSGNDIPEYNLCEEVGQQSCDQYLAPYMSIIYVFISVLFRHYDTKRDRLLVILWSA